MNILLYDVGNKQHGIAYPLKVALEKLSITVDIFDWSRYLISTISKTSFLKPFDKYFISLSTHLINKNLIESTRNNKYDAIIVMRGDHIIKSTLLEIKNKSCVIINWNTDDIFNNLNSNKNILESFTIYDCHMSPRLNLQDDYISKGAKKFHKIDWYYRDDVIGNFDTQNYNNKDYDISFVGSWSHRRESILSHLNEFNLNVWGWGWKRKCINKSISNNVKGSHIPMTSALSIFNNSKVNINILTHENRDTSNIRNFEISSVSGFQICERSDYLVDLFKEDIEMVYFSETDELVDKCKFYLNNDSLREKIAKASYERVVQSKHSISDRAKEIVDLISSLK
ncbi:glycosyltransferase [Thiothrix unzii]|uniref:CgeB family protein n=1 Tax=Thiothrix unzii TaxID=111769 RepID=UPI002A36A8F4|nr:glycosyltransferase [Thiothrix unzii]MDX9988228.1 glycosyltransferase [Thiothrix unzii]